VESGVISEVESPVLRVAEEQNLFENGTIESPSRFVETPSAEFIPPALEISAEEIAKEEARSKILSEIESLTTRIQQQESTLTTQKNPILKARAQSALDALKKNLAEKNQELESL
jgi:TATA-binding protein-associated factor Taf7